VVEPPREDLESGPPGLEALQDHDLAVVLLQHLVRGVQQRNHRGPNEDDVRRFDAVGVGDADPVTASFREDGVGQDVALETGETIRAGVGLGLVEARDSLVPGVVRRRVGAVIALDQSGVRKDESIDGNRAEVQIRSESHILFDLFTQCLHGRYS